MTDAREISNRIAGMLLAIDRVDWDAARSAFADEVTIDYASLFGGEPALLPRDQLIATWRGLVPGFDATQHVIGPVVSTLSADEGSAVARTSVRGYQFIKGVEGGEAWMVAGQYTFGLVRTASSWLITSITLTVAYEEGNFGLAAVAQKRAAISPREK